MSANAKRLAKMFLTNVGSGRDVLLLHGWGCDSHDWMWQLPALERRYRVVAPDLRGHGRSEIMPTGLYSPDHYVSDIEALITTEYSGRRFVVIGHSMGGQIAARLADRRPDLVAAVVSVDGALGFSGETGALFAQVNDDMQAGDPAKAAITMFQLAYAPTTESALGRWHARRVQGVPAHVLRESFAPLFFGADQAGIEEGSAALCRRIERPVYHLCRDQAQADRMRPWFSHPHSKVDVWPDAGHWIMQDRSDEVNKALTDWIDALAPSGDRKDSEHA